MRSETPDLDGSIQRSTGKGVGVLGVEFDLHDVVGMSFKDLRTIKSTVPVPQLDAHIVGGGQDVWKRRMDLQATNVIGMGFKLLDLFHGVVVEHTQSHVGGGGQEPLFAGDEFRTSHGELGNFKGLDEASRFVIPDHDITRVKSGQHPWFRRVNIHTLDTFTGSRKLLLDVQAEGLEY